MYDIFFASVRPGFYCFLLLCILSIQFNENNKKERIEEKNWGSHWNMVLIIMKSYGLKNPFHLTSEVPVSSTELWLPVTRNKSIERTSYQFINITYDYLESSLVWFNFANSPRGDVKLGMSGGKIKKVSNVETLWWPKVLFHVVFADRGAIRNFSLFFRYFANVFINVSAGKWQTTFTSINLLLAINVKSVNDLLVVELIFQFCAFREKWQFSIYLKKAPLEIFPTCRCILIFVHCECTNKTY